MCAREHNNALHNSAETGQIMQGVRFLARTRARM
jgi:hypothetical protein